MRGAERSAPDDPLEEQIASADVGGRDWHVMHALRKSADRSQRIISSVCVCIVWLRQTDRAWAGSETHSQTHTAHTAARQASYTAAALSLSEDGCFVGLEGMSRAFSFFLSLTHAELRDKTAFETEAGFTVCVCPSLADHMRVLFHRL